MRGLYIIAAKASRIYQRIFLENQGNTCSILYHTVVIMYVEERLTEIGTGTQKGYYEDFHNRVSKEDEMLFKLKDNKSAYSNGYTLVVEKLIVNEH